MLGVIPNINDKAAWLEALKQKRTHFQKLEDKVREK
jgi:hypothetical protein